MHTALLGNSFSDSNNNSEHLAFALINGQPISQKLKYAHFEFTSSYVYDFCLDTRSIINK
jgi:hypothetical protein